MHFANHTAVLCFVLSIILSYIVLLQSDDFRQQCIKKSDVVHGVVGSGPHRKIVLSPQTDKQCGTE